MNNLIQQGIYSMTEAEYRPLPGLNQSSIPHLLKSGAHYLANLAKPRSPTKEQALGTGFHALVLEPERFKKDFVVKSVDGRTVSGKKFLLENEMIHKKTIISEEDFEKITAMEANVRRHEIAGPKLTSGFSEQAILFELKASNGNVVKCKAKVDWMADGVMIDLKTTKNAEPDAFNDSIGKYSYEIQGAFYSHAIEALGYDRPNFYFIAVESEAPFAVSVIRLSDSDYAKGYAKLYRAVNLYEECSRLGKWPSYESKVFESKTRPWI